MGLQENAKFNRDRYDSGLLMWDSDALGAGANTSTVINKFVGEGAGIKINLEAVSGTSPTLDCVVSGSKDGSTYVEVFDFPQIVEADDGEDFFMPLPITDYDYWKIVGTVGGSATPIMTVTAFMTF